MSDANIYNFLKPRFQRLRLIFSHYIKNSVIHDKPSFHLYYGGIKYLKEELILQFFQNILLVNRPFYTRKVFLSFFLP